MNKRKKQFIAGAICPQCTDTDSLVLYADDQSIACVSCDYKKTSTQRDRESKKNTNITNKNIGSIQITNLSE